MESNTQKQNYDIAKRNEEIFAVIANSFGHDCSGTFSWKIAFQGRRRSFFVC